MALRSQRRHAETIFVEDASPVKKGLLERHLQVAKPMDGVTGGVSKVPSRQTNGTTVK